MNGDLIAEMEAAFWADPTSTIGDRRRMEAVLRAVAYHLCRKSMAGEDPFAVLEGVFDQQTKAHEKRAAPYGHCPHCGAPGLSRERRPDGNDTCEKGHIYPSAAAKP